MNRAAAQQAMRIRHPGADVPDTTPRLLAGRPRRGNPVGAVWSRLDELDRAGNDPALVGALRAVLLPHQPSRGGRCPVCPTRWGRRRRWPCIVWHRVHVALFSACVTTPERGSGARSAAVSGFPAGHRPNNEIPAAQPVPHPTITPPESTTTGTIR
jgi:hypothetical protein